MTSTQNPACRVEVFHRQNETWDMPPMVMGGKLALAMSEKEAGPNLRGRTEERATLDELLADARAGHSRVLVLSGEAGVGKTALLDYLCARASDCRVTRWVGVESEMELPFAALRQLAEPLLGSLDRLAEPQRAALVTALGLESGKPADRFLIGLAVLTCSPRSPRTSRWCGSSMTPTGWIGSRSRSSASSLGGCSPSASPSSSRCVVLPQTGSWLGCRSCRWER
jgi:AAA ATPase-like protein